MDESQKPNQSPQDPNPSQSSTIGANSPLEVEDLEASAPGIAIEDAFSEPEQPGPAQPEPEPVIEPYSEEEILNGVGIGLALGLRLQDEKEMEAFQEAWNWVVRPVLPTAGLLKALQVGKALASYGIGRGMVPGAGNIESLPAWLRLLLGFGLMGVSGFNGFRAIQALREKEAARAAQSQPA